MIRPLISLICSAAMVSVSAADNMKAFPSAEAGMTRHVLPLPAQPDEVALKVELIVGKMTQVDSVNRFFYGGNLEVETIQGWGFQRYVLKQLGPMAGTRMAPPEGAPKVDRFVTLGGEPYLVRYNSKLPLVIYVPQGVEVRYRIWRAEPEAKPVSEG